jgi:hypothetical protein
MAPGQDFTYSTNLYYALPFTTNIFCGTNGADSARDSYIVIWNKINHNFQFQSDSIAGLNWALTNFMGTNVSQTPVLQDVDWQTHFATNLSGICGPGGAWDGSVFQGSPMWWVDPSGNALFRGVGGISLQIAANPSVPGTVYVPGTLIAGNIQATTSILCGHEATITFYGQATGNMLALNDGGSALWGQAQDCGGFSIQDNTGTLNFYSGAATIDSSGNVVAASFADPAGDSLTANILTLNSTAVIGPDSGGNGGTTLMLQASDNGVPMYLHVTSLGVATWTTSP